MASGGTSLEDLEDLLETISDLLSDILNVMHETANDITAIRDAVETQ